MKTQISSKRLVVGKRKTQFQKFFFWWFISGVLIKINMRWVLNIKLKQWMETNKNENKLSIHKLLSLFSLRNLLLRRPMVLNSLILVAISLNYAPHQQQLLFWLTILWFIVSILYLNMAIICKKNFVCGKFLLFYWPKLSWWSIACN